MKASIPDSSVTVNRSLTSWKMSKSQEHIRKIARVKKTFPRKTKNMEVNFTPIYLVYLE